MGGVRVSRDGGVVTITLDRPEKRNAIDSPMFDDLRDALLAVGASETDRVVVLTGEGGSFSSGGDLAPSEPSGEDAVTMLRRFGQAARALHECPKPVLASVDGVAVGAGFSLVLGCDLVLASDRARFSLLFVRNGLSLDLGASWLLPRRVGPMIAAEMALLGDWVEADRALQLGIVNRVVAVDELATATADWARQLATLSPLAVQSIKRSLRGAENRSLAEALEFEAVTQAECAQSPELRAAIEARRR